MKLGKAARGIIFDMDGTLCDTLGDIAYAANLALEAVGAPVHPVADYAEWVGWGLRQLCATALGEESGSRFDRMYERAVEEYNKFPMDRSFPYPGIPDLLDALVGRGIPIGISSNKPHDFAARIVETIFARWSFVHVEGYKSDVARKPDPAGALRIAETMGLAPGEIALVGDSAVDVETALNAGMAPIGVSWGFRGPEELTGAMHIIDHPNELLEFVAR
ncbi:MAG: HAD-IA family hydrolase [Phycisphaerae bacterium]|nr:HAD-IA family hydrolase [Phycisphaerae bacterium]